jgi:hypothetical protein
METGEINPKTEINLEHEQTESMERRLGPEKLRKE